MSQEVTQQEEAVVLARHRFPRSESEEIQMALRQYRGKYYVDLRLWFQPKDNPEMRPTKKGISILASQLTNLKEGIQNLGNVYRKLQDGKGGSESS